MQRAPAIDQSRDKEVSFGKNNDYVLTVPDGDDDDDGEDEEDAQHRTKHCKTSESLVHPDQDAMA